MSTVRRARSRRRKWGLMIMHDPTKKLLAVVALLMIPIAGCTQLSAEDRALLDSTRQAALDAKATADRASDAANRAAAACSQGVDVARAAAASAARAAGDARLAAERADRMSQRSQRKPAR
jgi:hypothetical protein